MEIVSKPKKRTHGVGDTRLWRVYQAVKRRCLNPNTVNYKRYGGRGIKICDEWLPPDAFPIFRAWAMENGYADDLEIHRKDNDGNYEPGNCEWITVTENRNKQATLFVTAFGETKTVREWSKDPRCKVESVTLYGRLRAGHEPEGAITRPSGLRPSQA